MNNLALRDFGNGSEGAFDAKSKGVSPPVKLQKNTEMGKMLPLRGDSSCAESCNTRERQGLRSTHFFASHYELGDYLMSISFPSHCSYTTGLTRIRDRSGCWFDLDKPYLNVYLGVFGLGQSVILAFLIESGCFCTLECTYAGLVDWFNASFPSLKNGFDSRIPLAH